MSRLLLRGAHYTSQIATPMSRDKEDERKIARRSQSYVEQFSAKSDEVAGHWRQQDARYNVLPLVKMAAVFVAAVSLFTGCNRGGDAIKIGAIQPISGQISAYGTQSRDAIQMAVDEINAKGGVLGKKIELIVEDDEANPEKTVNAFKKLATQDKVLGIIGPLTSKSALAITKEAQQRKIILIPHSATNDAVTDAGNYIFRACYNDSFQGQVVAKFAFETLGVRNAAILFDNTNDYSKGLTDNFRKKFEELGGRIVSEESYATGDKDFNAQITKIKGTGPDALFIPDYYSTVSLIAKQVRNQGLSVPMLGADGWDEIVNNAGGEVAGSFYSNHYSPDAADADVKGFVKKYQERYKMIPNGLAALGYDALNMLVDSIARAGSTEPAKVQAEMMKTDKKFVTGQIKFNEKRNPVKSAVMVEVKKGANGELIAGFAGTVNP